MRLGRRRNMRRVIGWAAVFLIVIGGGLGSGVAHGGILSFDTAADVPLAPFPSSTGWYTDRYPPLIFAGGRSPPMEPMELYWRRLARSIRWPTGHRPTIARSITHRGGTRSAVGHHGADGSALCPAYLGRLCSKPEPWPPGQLLGHGLRRANNVTSFPIIEFNNNIDGASTNGFRIWDSFANTWDNVGGFAGYDHWYDIGFAIAGGQEQFFVNRGLVRTIADSSTRYFGNVILQGYNSGDSYDINWNNLNVDPPRPGRSTARAVVAGDVWLWGGELAGAREGERKKERGKPA